MVDVQTNASTAVGDPPSFVRLAAHPVRWRLLQELVRSDRAVLELTTLVDEPQSLVSYHLRLLRDGGLVSARRSSADRRDSYYTIDLVACRDGLDTTGGALHPAFHVATAPPPPRRDRRRADDGCCSSVPATAPGHRSPRRCSSTCPPAQSKPAAPAATPSRSTRTRSACSAAGGSTSARTARSTSTSSPPSASTRSSRCATECARCVRSSRHAPSTCTGASRSGAGGPDEPGLVSRLRAHRRRARAPHRLPAPPLDRPTNDEEDPQ